jgi:hypothetical protein
MRGMGLNTLGRRGFGMVSDQMRSERWRDRPSESVTEFVDEGDGIDIQTCCNFVIQDNFLLDTRNGDVWKYDDAKNEFEYVEKKREEKVEDNIFKATSLLMLKDDLDLAYKVMSKEEQDDKKDLYEIQKTLLHNKLNQHMTAIKIKLENSD